MPGVNCSSSGVLNNNHSNVTGISGSAFQPVRSSSPQYIGEYLHPRQLTNIDRDDDYDAVPNSPSYQQQQQRWHAASPKVFLANSSTVSLPASAVLGHRGRSATPTSSSASPVVEVNHKRSHSIGSNVHLVAQPKPVLRSERSSFEALAACEEQLEEKRKKAQEDRLKEQQQEREERARLDEILQMCAEYQRQIDQEQATAAAAAVASSPSSEFSTSPTLATPGAKKVAMGKPPPSPGHSLHPNR